MYGFIFILGIVQFLHSREKKSLRSGLQFPFQIIIYI